MIDTEGSTLSTSNDTDIGFYDADGNRIADDDDSDGVVDGSDFNIWNSNKFTNNTVWTRGIFNADTAIDGSDFNLWNSNKFTSSLRPGTPSGQLEPVGINAQNNGEQAKRRSLKKRVDRFFAAFAWTVRVAGTQKAGGKIQTSAQ